MPGLARGTTKTTTTITSTTTTLQNVSAVYTIGIEDQKAAGKEIIQSHSDFARSLSVIY